ncbi:alpha/beta hydrolase [Actinoallomurus sp. CA-142502]|uniref:alpha/beta hydrolase n=1 Tax=Actinoallomurus sp. CA-142502 TaxID=3239885 RepID=UPI003D8AE33A
MIDRTEVRIGCTSPLGTEWSVAGWLTVPEPAVRGELQILLHGGSYDHRYWDWPLDRETYSYVEYCRRSGHATLAIDRVGSGASSRPPGRLNTAAAQADALREIVTAARDGSLAGIAFERVVLVGHSFGSILAGLAASENGDVDAVVFTGHLGIDSGAMDDDPRSGILFHDVAEDPVVAHLCGLVDDGYLTLRSEARVPTFYVAENADERVLDVDEKIKGVMTLGEISDMGTAAEAWERIDVPVLALVGENDVMMFDSDIEVDTYQAVNRVKGKAPENFSFQVVPATGHNVNLHRNARSSYEHILRWLASLA